MRTAVVYVRMAPRLDGIHAPYMKQQLEELEAYCQSHDLEITETIMEVVRYAENDLASVWHAPQHADTLVVADMTRISRDRQTLDTFTTMVKQTGREIIYALE